MALLLLSPFLRMGTEVQRDTMICPLSQSFIVRDPHPLGTLRPSLPSMASVLGLYGSLQKFQTSQTNFAPESWCGLYAHGVFYKSWSRAAGAGWGSRLSAAQRSNHVLSFSHRSESYSGAARAKAETPGDRRKSLRVWWNILLKHLGFSKSDET